MKNLINMKPIFDLLNNKNKKPKEPTFTLSEVMALLEEALMRCEEDVRDIYWDDVEYDVDIDWDKRIYINNIDASSQIEEILDSVDNCFKSIINSYVEMQKENNK